ncbi:SdiA-regulated domain-containing protein [Longitalea luteola]|uniref:SdiA-regulated domain-containing protein n=1 Tax=Longitalea luteola TaxID=2812563 RepID=UPI001A970EA5|nr:SdiA-regulated domain-containing protein [Longitalea luteola]
MKLPVELDEISGVAFYSKDTSVFAIGDEFGWLYKIPLTVGKPIRKWKFSSEGDYEDLVMVDKVFYVLQSNGNITAFTFDDHNKILTQQQNFPASGNEFEILYYNPKIFKLVMLCKDCETDKKKALTAFYFNLLHKQFDDSSSINVTAIANMIGEEKIKFKPSAAAIHPITNELYIVSSVNKLLVITDQKGNVKQTFVLDPALFKQPEGITFTPEGDMIISNEAADRGVANLLFYKYNKKVKP